MTKIHHPEINVRSFCNLLLILVLVFAGFSCTSHRNGDTVVGEGETEAETDYMEMARSAWILNDFDKVIELLDPVSNNFDEESDDGEIKAEVNYLLGKAYFVRADTELSKHSMKTRMFQQMDTNAYGDLEKSMGYFEEAIWFDTSGNFSVDSNYTIGRILDVGYLQQMERALEYYQRAFTIDAESESGQKALARYKTLSEAFLQPGH